MYIHNYITYNVGMYIFELVHIMFVSNSIREEAHRPPRVSRMHKQTIVLLR